VTADQIVRAAIPDADDATVTHILWGRTPFPCAQVTAKELYRAASSWNRACAKKIRLCDFCWRIAEPGKWECRVCREGLDRCRREMNA
jgi:hypothetical protein